MEPVSGETTEQLLERVQKERNEHAKLAEQRDAKWKKIKTKAAFAFVILLTGYLSAELVRVAWHGRESFQGFSPAYRVVGFLCLSSSVLAVYRSCQRRKRLGNGSQADGIEMALFLPLFSLICTVLVLTMVVISRAVVDFGSSIKSFVSGDNFPAFITIVLILGVVCIWMFGPKSTPSATQTAETEQPPTPAATELALAPIVWQEPNVDGVCNQRHEHERFQIATRPMEDGSLEIRWRFKESGEAKGGTLFGYRSDSGFGEYALDRMAHGKLIAQSRADSAIYEFLKPGVEYFYTFVLTSWQSGLFSAPRESCEGVLRFKIAIPPEFDFVGKAKKLNALLDEALTFAKRKQSLAQLMQKIPAEQRSPLEKMLERVKSEVDMKNGIRQCRQDFITSLEKGKLSESEKAAQIEIFDEAVFQVTAELERQK